MKESIVSVVSRVYVQFVCHKNSGRLNVTPKLMVDTGRWMTVACRTVGGGRFDQPPSMLYLLDSVSKQ